jgi:hypothetical protein
MVAALSLIALAGCGYPGDQPGDPIDRARTLAAPDFPGHSVHTYCYRHMSDKTRSCWIDLMVSDREGRAAGLVDRWYRVLARTRADAASFVSGGSTFRWRGVILNIGGMVAYWACPGDPSGGAHLGHLINARDPNTPGGFAAPDVAAERGCQLAS